MSWMDQVIDDTLLACYRDRSAICREIDCIEEKLEDNQHLDEATLISMKKELADSLSNLEACKNYIAHVFSVQEKLRIRKSTQSAVLASSRKIAPHSYFSSDIRVGSDQCH